MEKSFLDGRRWLEKSRLPRLTVDTKNVLVMLAGYSAPGGPLTLPLLCTAGKILENPNLSLCTEPLYGVAQNPDYQTVKPTNSSTGDN